MTSPERFATRTFLPSRTSKPTRVGVRKNDAGKNVRFCKECDAVIPQGEL